MPNLSGVITASLLSLTAWPVLKLMTRLPELTNSTILAPTGFITFLAVVYLVKWFLPSNKQSKTDQNVNIIGRGVLFYTCCLFSFSSLASFIFYLDIMGFVKGYIGFYLETGERYFNTSYGTLALLWDFIVHFPLYIAIIYCIDNKKDCRNVVLYWASTMVTSLFIIIIGAMSGSYGSEILPASWLNIPYGVLSIYYLLKFLTQPRHFHQNRTYYKVKTHSFDAFLALGLTVILVFNVIRGLSSLNSPFPLAELYVREYEPYILHPTSFGRVWILFMLLVGSLLQIVLIFGLFQSNATWMLDWSIIYTAITVYGTYVHLIAQFCPGVDKIYQIPSDRTAFVISANLFLPVVAIATMLQSFSMVTDGKKFD